ncbi:MAG: universal stress protein [Acetobacteraceae bacterium]|nr:universal stress protein [Acetobacteraceae bacterium]
MLRDLLVVLDGSPHDEARLALALDLARRHDAHLTGFCPLDALAGVHPSVVVGPYPEMFAFPDAVREFRARATEKARSMEAEFRNQLRRQGVNGDWEAETGLPTDVVARRGRSTDLLVLGQADPEDMTLPSPMALIEDALMRTGRPLLLVPYAGRFETIGGNALIGWNDSREAARAAHDALPLLAPSARVTVLTVRHGRQVQDGDELPGAEVATHLARHGLRVTAACSVRDASVSDADVLLNHASDIGADLLVMGGYGRSRAREILLGGVTRSLLRCMTVPVLMSR